MQLPMDLKLRPDGKIDFQSATLTHHLNAMESAGLVTRRRDPANRRVHVVELTPAGDALFLHLRDAAMAFDQRLRTGLSERDLTEADREQFDIRSNQYAALAEEYRR